MTTVYEIPLSPVPQSLQIALGATTYKLTVTYNSSSELWNLDVADVSGAPILSGLPLVTGCDLLEQFAYLGFTGQLVTQTDHNPDAPPTVDNLGVLGRVFYIAP